MLNIKKILPFLSLLAIGTLCSCGESSLSLTEESSVEEISSSSSTSELSSSESEINLQPMDMYLIGGQSNAGGATKHKNMLNETFSNVMYAGQVNLQYANGVASSDNTQAFFTYSKKVKAGFGEETSKVGPEYGMAIAINDSYTTDNRAFIFKSAAGATGMVVDTKVAFGTWLPKSHWEDGYTPANTTTGIGFQYYSFINNFERVYTTLKQNGFLPIVKGMAWMQGESDLGAHKLYKTALYDFINDIRGDIYNITKNEADLKLPFVIGKINPSFEIYNNPLVPPMNQVQEEVASSLENCETIETSDFIVNDSTGPKGSDQYHFNYQDMESLGMRFANKILDICKGEN